MPRFQGPLRGIVVGSALLAAPGCMLLVNDGDYKVEADGSASSGSASGSSSGTSGATGTSGASGLDGSVHEDSSTPTSGLDAESPGREGGNVSADGASSAMDGGATGEDATPPFDAGPQPFDAGSQVCTVTANDNSCTACVKTSCCTAYTNCGAACSNILNCVSTCVDAIDVNSPCDCFAQNPTGVTQYLALLSCQDTSCNGGSTCDLGDVGDPCQNDFDCINFCGSGAPHGGMWCTNSDDSCVSSSDCINESWNSGDNSFGEVNSCVDDNGTETCFPGCVSSADCDAFPNTVCTPQTSVEGATVSICHL